MEGWKEKKRDSKQEVQYTDGSEYERRSIETSVGQSINKSINHEKAK